MENTKAEELKIMPRGEMPGSLRKGKNMICGCLRKRRGRKNMVFNHAGSCFERFAAENAFV